MQKQIENFGLIGKDISYSFSKKYFTQKFINEGLNNCSYENYDISSISELLEVINDTKIKGLNVTIPYKESVIELLNHIDPIAKKIGAVNTIKIDKQNKLLGYNTDYIGFKQSLESNISNQKRALILGTGGASKAIVYALKTLNIKTLLVSRKKREESITYEDISNQIIKDHTIIINCTPLGTYPNIEECPKIPYQYITERHLCYDLIYNPIKTKFLILSEKEGASIINGNEMLENQAIESWKIWNS
jgi:shikimate dehydrogenase